MRIRVRGPAPAAAWDVLRRFADPWHPWITQMQTEPGGIRAFRVVGEDTLYRERLTWFSDTLQELRYTHLQGISGVDRYDASVQISGGEVLWQADIEGPRAAEIAEGTRGIFEAGISALAKAAPPKPKRIQKATVKGQSLLLGGAPELALTISEGRDPPIVFLHGIGGGRGNWRKQMGVAGFRCAALDSRGYGDSALGTSQSTIENHCNDITSAMDAIGAEKIILCGLSFGAWIATSFAMRHPTRLAGLVLAGGCTGMSEASARGRNAFRTARETPLAAGKTPADFAPSVVDMIAGPQADSATREELFTSMAAIPAETYADSLRLFTNPPERFDFSRITMPVLLMTGAHDRLAPPAEIKAVANRIHSESTYANVWFEVIEGAGHVCNIEKPDAFNEALGAFCRMITG